MHGKSGAEPKDPVQQELERLRARVAELEHALEVQEWGAQLFTESALPQLILDFETGQIISANPSASQFYGYRVEELVQQHIADLSAKENCWNPELQATIESNRYGVVPACHRTASGEVRDLEAYYTLINLRGRKVIHALLIDVTERQRLFAQLEESEARYRTFIQMANEGIWRFEFDELMPIDLPVEEQVRWMWEKSYLAEANPAFAKMYGYESPEEMVGMHLTEFYVPDDPINFEVLRRLASENYRLDAAETIELDREGKQRHILNSMFGVVEGGFLVRVWGTQVDITELRQLQQQLEQAYRMETVGRLAGGIAHDFNNLLTAILGYAELGMSAAKSESVRRYFEGIRKASLRAAELTQQLLAYARRQVIQLKPFDVRAWLLNSEEFLRRVLTENIRLKINAESEVALILADETPMTQILLNLVVNARDAMPQGGTLTIRLSTTRAVDPSSETPTETDYVVLEVSDTGVGIPEDLRERIFEPFFTTKSVGQGTGMGLASVQGLVNQMGGFITVDSQVGKGTTFRVHFPVYSESNPPAGVS